MRRSDGRLDIGRLAVAKRRQQLFYGIGEFRDAFEADDGQRAMRLVHAGARLGQAVAARIGGVGGEARAGALEGKVDFTLDPGQRSDVEFDVHERVVVRPCAMNLLITP
ncbi:MAG: hypothetical protein Q7U41_01445 [Microbacterium sp.]|nr:hypothetical protein [Microbacterium sp.]